MKFLTLTPSLAFACLVLFIGCGTTNRSSPSPEALAVSRTPTAPASKPKSVIPSKRELDTIAAGAAPVAQAQTALIDAPGFALVGALSDVIEDRPPAAVSPWSAPLVAAPKPPRLSVAVECFARQMADFRLKKKAYPTNAFRRFAAARCGTAGVLPRFTLLEGGVPATVKDEAVAKRWGKQMATAAAKLQLDGAVAGGGHARQGKRAVWVLAWSHRRARVMPVPTGANKTGEVTIRGEILIPVHSVEALVTRGKYGFRHCRFDKRVRLPRFTVTCPVDPTDSKAWIEISAFERGRILGNYALRAMIRPTGKSVKVYRRSLRLSSTAQMDEPEALQTALVGLVNGVRKSAKLGLLTPAPAQSKILRKLAPHYFAATVFRTVPETLGDAIVMGIRAGWDVPGSVRQGYSSSSSMMTSRDLGVLVNDMLELPSGRMTLLSPDTSTIAVGSQHKPEMNGFLGVMFATYSLLDPALRRKAGVEIVAQLNAQRAKRGLGPVVLAAGMKQARVAAAEAIEGGRSDALTFLMRVMRQKLGGQPTGWTLTMASLEGISFPKDLLEASAPTIAVAVGLSRPPGIPWMTLRVLIAVAGPEASATL